MGAIVSVWTGSGSFSGEDVRVAEVGAVLVGYGRIAHELGEREELEERGFSGSVGSVPCVAVDAVKEVGLFVVVWG